MKKLILLLCLPLASAQQQYIISTVAGIGQLPFGGAGSPALNAHLISPQFVAADSAGNVFVSDTYYQQVFRISASGTITVYAGTGKPGFGGDGGPVAAAQLSNPLGLAMDAAGNLLIMDNGNGRVRKVSPDGTISTVAMVQGGAVTVDATGNLYVTQSLANIIHMVSPNGVVTTIAGTGKAGSSGDGGKATDAQLSNPIGLRTDAAGNLYVADSGNNKIRKITPQGIITTVAGNGQPGFAGDNLPATSARIQGPQDVAIGADGNLYIADTGNFRVRVVSPAGVISTFAGGVSAGTLGSSFNDGPADQALLQGPTGMFIDNKGSLDVAIPGNHQVRRVTVAGITTIAGVLPTVSAGDNIPAISAPLFDPYGVAVDNAGVIYISDVNDQRIRKVSTAGIISTFAGDGLLGQSIDGSPAILAGDPQALILDRAGNLYYTTFNGNLVRRIAPNGAVTTIAGSTIGFSGDGAPAVGAQLSLPLGIAIDAAGNTYIADSNNNRIRRVDISGKINTVAGTGVADYGGDNGPATAALLLHPSQLALDGNGNLYVADTGNNRVRMISPAGAISTVAGNGVAGDAGDGGDATAASVMSPSGIAVDAAGNLYISSRFGTRIRKVDAATGAISTIAGTTASGFSGDGGFATSAAISGAETLALDSSGNIYFTDERNQRVRKLSPAQITPAGVLNAASLLPGPVAPGEIVFINDSALGSAQMADTQVLFDGTPAALISVQASQVSAVVPYEVAGQTSTQLQIAVDGKNTNAVTIPVAGTAPGIFTQDSSGAGAGAILNADSTTNSPANPAAIGSVVTISATGEGQTVPAGVDGLIASGAPPAPVGMVSVQIGGNDAQVVSAGGVPGMMAGFFQVVVQIPAGAPSGDAIPVVLTVGGAASQPGVTISIQ